VTTLTLVVRALIFVLVGYYYLFIKSQYARILLYFFISIVTETPHLILMYIQHYRDFQPQPPSNLSVSSVQNTTVQDDDDRILEED
jgi:hypothetical protein